MRAHQKQRGDERPEAAGHKAPSGEQHDADFENLGQAHQHRFFVFVGDLPAGRRKEEKGQDKQTGQQGRQHLAVQRGELPGAESDQRDQRRLEHVVVKRAEKLGKKEGTEALLAHQLKLVAHGDDFSSVFA